MTRMFTDLANVKKPRWLGGPCGWVGWVEVLGWDAVIGWAEGGPPKEFSFSRGGLEDFFQLQ